MPDEEGASRRPEGGPGLAPRDTMDPVAWVAAGLVALALIPTNWFQSAFTAHALGPIAFPVILGIAGVLFGFVTVFRYVDHRHRPSLNVGVAATAVGLVRVLVYPLAGW